MTENINKANSGVSREEAENILKKFLDNENYKVLGVKGNWGVGKTHLVQSFLYKHKKEYYYYGSVFGISSIEQLKARILANYKNNLESNNKDYQTKNEFHLNFVNNIINNVFEWINRNSKRLEQTRKVDLVLPGQSPMPIVVSLISVAGDLALNILFNINVNNSIICIDDLERKSKLPMDELLGFVEYLVQELKCKIILIYNEDILLENTKTLDITIALKKIINSNTQSISPWLKADIEFLNNSTIEEYCQWLEEGDPDLYSIVRQFLALGLPASQKLEQAICSLAKSSNLNKIRAKFIYNIDNISNNEH